nr:MAG TPA: hypothetical protein [Caudoviricetes sp.]
MLTGWLSLRRVVICLSLTAISVPAGRSWSAMTLQAAIRATVGDFIGGLSGRPGASPRPVRVGQRALRAPMSRQPVKVSQSQRSLCRLLLGVPSWGRPHWSTSWKTCWSPMVSVQRVRSLPAASVRGAASSWAVCRAGLVLAVMSLSFLLVI